MILPDSCWSQYLLCVWKGFAEASKSWQPPAPRKSTATGGGAALIQTSSIIVSGILVRNISSALSCICICVSISISILFVLALVLVLVFLFSPDTPRTGPSRCRTPCQSNPLVTFDK